MYAGHDSVGARGTDGTDGEIFLVNGVARAYARAREMVLYVWIICPMCPSVSESRMNKGCALGQIENASAPMCPNLGLSVPRARVAGVIGWGLMHTNSGKPPRTATLESFESAFFHRLTKRFRGPCSFTGSLGIFFPTAK